MEDRKVLGQQFWKDRASRISKASASFTPDCLERVNRGHSPLENDVADSSLAHSSECDKENSQFCFSEKVDEEYRVKNKRSKIVGLDLNTSDTSSMVDDNPFYTFDKLGKFKPLDPSECASTAGPLEESEPLRMWNEMKQNCFLSSSHGGAPQGKQKNRKPRRKKDNGSNKKTNFVQRGQVSRFAKVAPPSGLLSGLKPGIINHARNSKQVRSFLEAVLRSEKNDGLIGQNTADRTRQEIREHIYRGKAESNAHDSSSNQFTKLLSESFVPPECSGESNQQTTAERKLYCGRPTTSKFLEEDEDDWLKQKIPSDIATNTSVDNFSANTDNDTSLSFKGATVASRWLDLLHLDIKLRLEMLRRSRRRVRNTIQTELPYLLSTEFSLSQENIPLSSHSLDYVCEDKAISEIHLAQWTSLFNHLDRALNEEAKYLENWLKQVQEMQSHCEKGLKYVGTDGFSQLESIGNLLSALKKSEAFENACALKAAAASIYSTCNSIMTSKNA